MKIFVIVDWPRLPTVPWLHRWRHPGREPTTHHLRHWTATKDPMTSPQMVPRWNVQDPEGTIWATLLRPRLPLCFVLMSRRRAQDYTAVSLPMFNTNYQHITVIYGRLLATFFLGL